MTETSRSVSRGGVRLGAGALLLGLVLTVTGYMWAASGSGSDANIGAGLIGVLGAGVLLRGIAVLIRAAVAHARGR